MRLLLDTHVLLWWLLNPESLTERARDAIADPANGVLISAASAWEVAIKRSLGRLEAPDDLERQIEATRFEPLSITLAHALRAGSLPRHHNDPFDRMLVAQSMVEGLTIVTRDPRLSPYGVPVLAA